MDIPPHFDDPLRSNNTSWPQQQTQDQPHEAQVIRPIVHPNEPQDSNAAAKQPTSNPEPILSNNEPPVMGGTIGSAMDYMDQPLREDVPGSSNDPGIITDYHHRRRDSNDDDNVQRSPSFRIGRGEPIVIDAEKWLEETASSRRGNQEKQHQGGMGIQSLLFKNPFSIVTSTGSGSGSSGHKEKKASRQKTTLDAQRKAAHEDYKRKYRGIPFEKDVSSSSLANPSTAGAAAASSSSKYRTLVVEPCRAKFLVTKVRSWRTGYCRILSLHGTYFTTIDPETHEITNLWYYSQIRHCIALPQEEDCILMDVLEDQKGAVVKLKFKCLPRNRNQVLTAIMEHLFLLEMESVKSYLMMQQSPTFQHVLFAKCQRLTRYNTRVDSALLCAPHGILELDRVTGMPVRTYYYKCIRAVCFLGDDVNGIVFYMNETNVVVPATNFVRCDCKVWFIESSRVGGSGRSEILTVLKNKFAALAMPLNISESVGLAAVNEIRKTRGMTSLVGEWIGSFRVAKFSQRRFCLSQHNEYKRQQQQRQQQQQQQQQEIDLILTRGGYILEVDLDGGVKSCRSLRDVICIVKHNSVVAVEEQRVGALTPLRKFTIEFKGGLQRTYSGDERDTVIVSILDITVYTCKNFDVTVTDVPSCGYSMLCFSEEDGSKGSSISTAQNLFQPDPIDSQCLKLLYDVSTVTNANVQYCCFVNSPIEIRMLINECVALIECCREFNANIRLRAVNNLPEDKKVIEGTIDALWDLCVCFVEYIKMENDQEGPLSSTEKHADDKEQVANILVSILQSLYRLMMTDVGYSTTAENKEMLSCVKSIVEMNHNLAHYWFLKCLSALVLPRPFIDERDKRNELMNKNILLDMKTGIISALVSAIKGTQRRQKSYEVSSKQFRRNSSDLVIMVASNIIESILCSHRETTPSEKGSQLIQEIRENQYIIIDMLRSSAAIIIENAAVILQILSCQLPDAAKVVRHSALISGMLLNHFYHAIFSNSEGQRHVSRLLCNLWMSGQSSCAEKLLLNRLLPSGFCHYLSMPALSEEEENQLEDMEKGENSNAFHVDSSELTGSSATNIERFRSRVKKTRSLKTNIESEDQKENFRIFFHVLNQDHSLPDLIWNDSTRKDLRNALKSELALINTKVAQYGTNRVAWNFEQFKVDYSSLRDEVRVGSVYMRLWLEASDSFIRSWEDPVRLLEHLFRRLLCDIDRNVTVANICIRCLERLYAIHFKKIGSFPDILVLFRCMRTTDNIETRHRLFSLLMLLIGSDENSVRLAECGGNLSQFLNEESIQFFCRLSAETHFDPNLSKNCSLPTKIPALWYTAPPGSTPPNPESINGPFTIEDLKVQMRNGKINRSYLTSVCDVRENDLSDNVDEWEDLQNVWQLRRQLLDNGSPSFSYSPSMVSTLSLRSLEKLVLAHDSIDSRGIPYFPIPLAKRLICGDAFHSSSAGLLRGNRISCLPIICQCILSQDHDVVNSAASLIRHLMSHNEMACRKLYLTGVFFFAFTNNLSDWKCIAQMIHETILTQKDTSLKSGGALDQLEDVTSILHQMIPDGLVKVLINHGPKQFAEVFVGNYDTPEVIWSTHMRDYLRSVLLEHLGDFPARLRENCILHYDYRPLQKKVCYDRLQNEVFCYDYYLGNLCDEKRFHDWPIREPLSLLNACIEQWESLEKQDNEDTMSIDKAIPILQWNEDANEVDLKPANRGEQETLQRFRGSFDNVEDSLTISETSPKLTSDSTKRVSNREDKRIDEKIQHELLMKAQILICKRYPEEIGNLKYSAYRTLLSFVKRQLGNDKEDPYTAKVIHTAISLIFYSCLVSPLNAEELICEGGVLVLTEVLISHIDYVCSLQMVENSRNKLLLPMHMETLVHVVHTIAGISYYESGRLALESLPDFLNFFDKWQTCVDLHSLGENVYGCNLVKRYALEGVINMAKLQGLQRRLSKSGIVWNLIHFCLDYDPSFELSSPDTDQCERSLSKVELNYCGGLAARALGMLCGVMDGEFSSPSNQSLYDLMKHVLTPPIAAMLRSSNTEKLLRTLNVDIKSPIRMWDIKMKDELKSFVSQMESTFRSSNVVPSLDVDVVKRFQYSNLSDQIIIGGVYVRMFNSMGLTEAIKEIPSMPEFVRSLLKFIGRSLVNDIGDCDTIEIAFVESHPINTLTCENLDCERDSLWYPVTDDKFVVCLEAVLRLSKADGIFDDILCQTYSVGILLSLMRVDSKCECFPIAIEILAELCPKQIFAEAILNRGLIPWYLALLEFQECDSSEDTCKKNPRWSVLELLASSSVVATHLVNSSGWLELLGLLAGCERFNTTWSNRNGSAHVLARLLCDPQVSSTAASKLQKIIPPGLVTILKRSGAEAVIMAFDKDIESPELIWDESMRLEVRNIISDFMSTIFDAENQRVTQNVVFGLPRDFHFSYRKLKEEVCIGGVYVRLFLKLQSSCHLEDPTGFLEALLFRWSTEMEFAINRPLDYPVQDDSDKCNIIDLVTKATLLTFKLYPFLCQKMSSWGYTKQIVHFLIKNKLNNLLEIHLISCIRLLLALSSDLSIVEDIILLTDSGGKNGVVDGVINAIDGNPLHNETALMLEALKQIFKTALGDVHNCPSINHLTVFHNNNILVENTLTPSPAPGKESVSKMKMAAADHPLAMMVDNSPSSTKKKTISVRPSFEKNIIPSDRYRISPSKKTSSPPLKTSRTIQQHTTAKSIHAYKDEIAPIRLSHTSTCPTTLHKAAYNLSGASIIESEKTPSYDNCVVDNLQPHSNQKRNQDSGLTNNTIGTLPNKIDSSISPHNMTLERPLHINGKDLNRSGANENFQGQHKIFVTSTEPPNSNPLFYQTAEPINKQSVDNNHKSDPNISLPYAITSGSVNGIFPYDFCAMAKHLMGTVAGAPNSAKGRCILLDSALECELPQFLVINILENPRLEFAVKDKKSTESHVMELLQLLLKDPGYGLKFRIVLESIPTWRSKYSQHISYD